MQTCVSLRLASVLLACSAAVWPSLSHAQSATATAATTSPSQSGFSSTAGADDEDATTPATTKKKKKAVSGETTGSIADEPLRIGMTPDDPAAADFGRANVAETGIDSLRLRQNAGRDDAQGIRLGTFILRPSVSQSIGTESNSSGSTKQTRSYLQTEMKGTLTSDWSSNQLTITGDGIYQKNVSGQLATEPSATLDADLRLDFSDDTVAHVTGGYSFSREGTNDPNAIDGADVQSGVNSFNAGVSVLREFGRLRGTVAVNGQYSTYSDARLSDGTQVALKDRDNFAGGLRGRIGYELSPAIIPFIEASIGRTIYDQSVDTSGYMRSSHNYAGRSGVELDLGEKLKGELGLGYERVKFKDSRLTSIDAFTLDGNAAWSPQRGTDVTFGLATSVEPSTTAGESGYTSYALNTGLAHEVRDNVVARLAGSTTWRKYSGTTGSRNETVYAAGSGLTWGLNRYLDLTGDLSYELTTRDSGADSKILRAGIGLTLKR